MSFSDSDSGEFLNEETKELVLSVNWESGPLGAMQSWPAHLRTAAGFCFNSCNPAIVWWGSQYTELHNSAFRTMLGDSYSSSLGKSGKEGHAAIWNISAAAISGVTANKKPIVSENNIVLISGEDRCFTIVYQPVYAPDAAVAGVFATLQETTAQLESNRRLDDAEQRLRLAIETAAIGTYDYDIQKDELVYSDRLAMMFAYADPKGLRHESFTARIHPDDLQIRNEAHALALKTGVLFYELRLQLPDNSIRWIRSNGKVTYTEDGKPHKLYGISLDITEQKTQADQLEKKVAERTKQLLIQNDEIIHQKQLMDTIVDSSVDYICAIDQNEDLLLFNKKYEDLTGYKRDIAVGKNIIAIFPHLALDPGGTLKNFRFALAGNYVHVERFHSVLNNRYFENFFIPLKSYSGEVFGGMLIGHDITDRILSEEKLMRTNEELTTSNQRLEQFAYVASHDLQEPLRKIQTFAELAQKNFDNREESEKYFSKIGSSAQRMSALIKDVLAYSRLSDTDVVFKDIDLNQIVQNVEIDFELLIAQKHAVLEYDKLPTIKGIPLQLNQLFSNLISNSLKFSKREPRISIASSIVPAEEIKKYIELDSGLTYVKLVFRDNGIGFDPQYADQIFTIFQRLNDRQSYSGTGIGLALCKKIVENHHGSVFAGSEPGEGATFTIYLPS